MNNTFEIQTGKVYVSDPCYEVGTWCQLHLEKVRTGTWQMDMEHDDHEVVSALVCRHIDCRYPLFGELAGEIGVDSGQAGVFDSQYYKSNKVAQGIELTSEDSPIVDEDSDEYEDGGAWYNLCCDKTLGDECGGVIPFGALSSSGYGDGGYNVWVAKENDEIVGIKIIFVEEPENGYCPHCGGDLDSSGYCDGCSAYEDDEKCYECGEFLDYDGVCPNHCDEEDEDDEV